MILALDELYGEFKETVPKEVRGGFRVQFSVEIDKALAADGMPYSYRQIRSAKWDASGKLIFG